MQLICETHFISAGRPDLTFWSTGLQGLRRGIILAKVATFWVLMLIHVLCLGQMDTNANTKNDLYTCIHTYSPPGSSTQKVQQSMRT